jgi:hypothetical protein
MRTTLTLDDDVAIELERLKVQLHTSFKEVVNNILRAGLRTTKSIPNTTEKRTRPVSLGTLRLTNVDNVAEVLAILEGEDYK